MKKIRTLIADDEPLARERIATLLRAEDDIEVVGECQDGPRAAAARTASPEPPCPPGDLAQAMRKRRRRYRPRCGVWQADRSDHP